VAGEDVHDETVALKRVQRAEMVKAFIISAEYRERFAGSPTGNQQGVALEAETSRKTGEGETPFADALREGVRQIFRTVFYSG